MLVSYIIEIGNIVVGEQQRHLFPSNTVRINDILEIFYRTSSELDIGKDLSILDTLNRPD